MYDLDPQKNFIPTTIPIPRYTYTPLARAYVIFQEFPKTYPLEEGFQKGTLFPDLYVPYDTRKYAKKEEV